MESRRNRRRLIGIIAHDAGPNTAIVEGIRDYARTRPHWQMIAGTYVPAAEQLTRELPLDGLIYAGDRPWGPILEPLRIPMVNVSYARSELGTPQVTIDDAQITELALEHFLERRFQHFAFVGYSDADFSHIRQAAFKRGLARLGHRLHVFCRSSARLRNWAGDALAHWIASLPRPLALWMCNDHLSFRVTEACRRSELTIPEDVAVLGADNRMISCELVRPAISSIIMPNRQIGWEATGLLDRMLNGHAPPREPLRLPSPGIVTRASTDVHHHGDPIVAAALRFIRDSAHRPISVDEILAHVPASRSMLERRFRNELGTTPLREIQRAHVEIARRLLTRTAMPMSRIATASGFRHASHLSLIFKKITGLTPSSYRRRSRREGPITSDPGEVIVDTDDVK
jgi:LacI family transcriptional regulator